MFWLAKRKKRAFFFLFTASRLSLYNTRLAYTQQVYLLHALKREILHALTQVGTTFQQSLGLSSYKLTSNGCSGMLIHFYV